MLSTTCLAQGSNPAATVIPPSGVGAAQSFTFTFSDPSGVFSSTQGHMLINSSQNGQDSCYLIYVTATNSLYLHTDDGIAFTGPLTPGGSGTLSNSQCSVPVSSAAASVSGGNLVVTADISFAVAFEGNKNIYMLTYDNGFNGGWIAAGTWTVSGARYQLHEEYETTLGAVDGINKIFMLSLAPAFPPDVYVNGLKMRLTADYSFSGQLIVFNSAAQVPTGTYIEADYWH